MRNWRWYALLVILVAASAVTTSFHTKAAASPRVVAISAKRFEFSPNQIRLKKGEPVTLRLRTEDVKHGLLQKALKIDADIVPGETTEVTLTPQVAGTFTTICNNFCGSGHGNMKMTIVVE
jgi:cytochrome c oxidase subunit II